MKEETPRSSRIYIGVFGCRNVGKSSLVNAISGQQTALVSDIPGTTTDVVFKNMEIPEVGACVLMDTPGYDDTGHLGQMRVGQTRDVAARTDVALLVFGADKLMQALDKNGNLKDELLKEDIYWKRYFEQKGVPVVFLLNKTDGCGQVDKLVAILSSALGGSRVVATSARKKKSIDSLYAAIIGALPPTNETDDLTHGLIKEGELVLLVMPQDAQAPKGRLILPQVQTLRNLLDKKCIVMSCTTEKLADALVALSVSPSWIITDSQVFDVVERLCPVETKLTSFSILFARYKGDMELFIAGAKILHSLHKDSRVLIAEACSHIPLQEDIGRVKLPRLLRAKIHPDLQIDVMSGNDFPENLSDYDLVIHCGACMFTPRHVRQRLQRIAQQGVPVTNYGVAIASLNGILDRVVF